MSTDQELAAASAGLTNNLPGMNIFGAGRSTMAVLPEMMQLGEVMRMRADQTKDAYAIRGLDRAEQSAFAEADEFGAFQEHLKSTAGMSDIDRAKANQNALISNPKWTANPFIKDSLSQLDQSGASLLSARKNELEVKQVEQGMWAAGIEESMREEAVKTARINSRTALKQAEDGAVEYDAKVEQGQFDNALSLSEALHSSGMGQKAKERVAVLADRFGADPVDQARVRGISKIVGSFSRAPAVARVYAAELTPYQEVYNQMKSDGLAVDPTDPNQTPQSIAASFDQAMSNVGKTGARLEDQSKMLARITEAKAAMMVLANHVSLANTAEAEFVAGLEEKMKDSSPGGKQALREFTVEWGVKAGEFSGIYKQQMEEHALKLKTEEEQLKQDDVRSKIAARVSGATAAEARIVLQEYGFVFKASQNKSAQIASVLKAILPDEISEEDGVIDIEAYEQKAREIVEANDATPLVPDVSKKLPGTNDALD
jgi:hypothetical protein